MKKLKLDSLIGINMLTNCSDSEVGLVKSNTLPSPGPQNRNSKDLDSGFHDQPCLFSKRVLFDVKNPPRIESSPDNKYLAVWQPDVEFSLRVYSLPSGDLVAHLLVDKGSKIRPILTFSCDGNYLATTAGYEGRKSHRTGFTRTIRHLKVFRTSDWACVKTFEDTEADFAFFLPDHHILVTSSGAQIRLLNFLDYHTNHLQPIMIEAATIYSTKRPYITDMRVLTKPGRLPLRAKHVALVGIVYRTLLDIRGHGGVASGTEIWEFTTHDDGRVSGKFKRSCDGMDFGGRSQSFLNGKPSNGHDWSVILLDRDDKTLKVIDVQKMQVEWTFDSSEDISWGKEFWGGIRNPALKPRQVYCAGTTCFFPMVGKQGAPRGPTLQLWVLHEAPRKHELRFQVSAGKGNSFASSPFVVNGNSMSDHGNIQLAAVVRVGSVGEEHILKVWNVRLGVQIMRDYGMEGLP